MKIEKKYQIRRSIIQAIHNQIMVTEKFTNFELILKLGKHSKNKY